MMKHVFILAIALLSVLTASGQSADSELSRLEGQWRLIASNNGHRGDDGIYRAGVDTIFFTAQLAENAGSSELLCHADKFYTRASRPYPADWRMAVERDAATASLRVGMKLAVDQPLSSEEFAESTEQYLDEGLYYFGVASGRSDTGHRYLFLLSENIDTHRLEPMTLWSSWLSSDATFFALPQNQQLYLVASIDEQYVVGGGSAVGYIEIWASPKLEKIDSSSAAIGSPRATRREPHDAAVYDLGGRRVSSGRHGLFVSGGKKTVK